MRARGLTLIAVALSACVTMTPANPSASSAPFAGDVLDCARLDSVRHPDVYAAIEAIRPEWLRRRGNVQAVAYVDGLRMGAPGELRAVLLSNVRDVRFLSPGEATTRYGTGHTGGAILLTTRRGPDRARPCSVRP